MKKIAIICLALLVCLGSLAGCSNIENDSTRTKTEGSLTGAGIGAVIGGILGQIIGGDTAGTLIGAAVGAAAGGVAGYAYGSHVAGEKEKYASQEDWLNACIASAQQVNQETRAYNQKLVAQLGKLQQECNQLAALYEARKAKKSHLLAEKKKIDTSLEEANKALERAKFEVQEQEKVLAEARESDKKQQAAQLDQQIQMLRKQIAELEGHTESLASMSARMAV